MILVLLTNKAGNNHYVQQKLEQLFQNANLTTQNEIIYKPKCVLCWVFVSQLLLSLITWIIVFYFIFTFNSFPTYYPIISCMILSLNVGIFTSSFHSGILFCYLLFSDLCSFNIFIAYSSFNRQRIFNILNTLLKDSLHSVK